ncbi:MAG: hypothetical protein GX601_08020 [Anaerolineales bacterium]|nr:hypothetical protein [Anaerolineales bacterium]
MDVESLDTSQTYDLTGWTARWEQEGKYRKVVALIGDEVPADVAEDDGIPW